MKNALQKLQQTTPRKTQPQSATPEMMRVVNDAKTAQQSGNVAGQEAASREMVVELEKQRVKSDETQVKDMTKAQGDLDNAFTTYYNMLSTSQLDNLYTQDE